METGAAPAVAGRYMGRVKPVDLHPGAGQEPGGKRLFPARDGIILPVLQAAPATGGKDRAVGFAPLWRRFQDFGQDGLQPLAADADGLRHDTLARQRGRHEHGMVRGDMIMPPRRGADTVTTPADMGDLEFHRRRVAGQSTGAVAFSVGMAALHDTGPQMLRANQTTRPMI